MFTKNHSTKTYQTKLFSIFLWIIILFSSIDSINTFAQQEFEVSKINFSIAKGNGLSNDVINDQILFMLKLPKFGKLAENISYENDLTFEYFSGIGRSNFLLGLTPLLKWDVTILGFPFFIKGGIGINYISMPEIAGRDLGGNFIFSDMIGLGIELFNVSDICVELSYLFRHISNAGLYSGNEGYNSQYIMLSFNLL
jgi:hypothetical protein